MAFNFKPYIFDASPICFHGKAVKPPFLPMLPCKTSPFHPVVSQHVSPYFPWYKNQICFCNFPGHFPMFPISSAIFQVIFPGFPHLSMGTSTQPVWKPWVPTPGAAVARTRSWRPWPSWSARACPATNSWSSWRRSAPGAIFPMDPDSMCYVNHMSIVEYDFPSIDMTYL